MCNGGFADQNWLAHILRHRFQTAGEMGDAIQDFINGAALSCDAAQIGEYMRDEFASELEAEAAGQAVTFIGVCLTGGIAEAPIKAIAIIMVFLDI